MPAAVRKGRLARSIAGSVVLAAMPPLDVAFVPYAPGTGDLARVGTAATQPWRSPLRVAGHSLMWVGMSAGAVWITHSPWPAPQPTAPRVEAMTSFAVASSALMGILGMNSVLRRTPFERLHTLVVLGRGGCGLSLAGTF